MHGRDTHNMARGSRGAGWHFFGKEKKKKCIIIAWYYTNVHLTVFWAQIHQKCAPNCAKHVHKSQNFPTSRGEAPLRHPPVSLYIATKISPLHFLTRSAVPVIQQYDTCTINCAELSNSISLLSTELHHKIGSQTFKVELLAVRVEPSKFRRGWGKKCEVKGLTPPKLIGFSHFVYCLWTTLLLFFIFLSF